MNNSEIFKMPFGRLLGIHRLGREEGPHGCGGTYHHPLAHSRISRRENPKVAHRETLVHRKNSDMRSVEPPEICLQLLQHGSCRNLCCALSIRSATVPSCRLFVQYCL
jgi:hypothetical protein